MSSNPPILVIGAASLDLKGHASGELFHGASSPGLVRSSVGGVARNVAENLARLGVNVALMTAIGDDTIGQTVLREARESALTRSIIVVEGGTHRRVPGRARLGGALHAAAHDMAVLDAISPLHPRAA
jgi:pseudouridine kinase